MQFLPRSCLRFILFIGVSVIFWQQAPAQDAPSKEAQAREAKGLPPRAGPGDYQAHAQAGSVTVAAEFTAHSVPTAEATFSTEDYVVVEVGLFGPDGAHLNVSLADFSLRINGKKMPMPAQPYALAFKSMKDPEWSPPAPPEKSKTSIGGGGGGQNDVPPAPVHMPFELVRAMQQRVQKAALPEGDRILPVAGLIFFEYRGSKIQSVELAYSGSAGSATLSLHP